MAARIVWSRNALEDKIRILHYWNERTGSNTYSKRLNKSLSDAVNLLKGFPNLGRNMPGSDTQFAVKDYYQIFYKYANDEIRILHIWDSRRNPDCLEIKE